MADYTDGLLDVERLIASKEETTYGDVVSLAAADAAFWVLEPNMVINGEPQEMPAQGTGGLAWVQPGAQSVECTYKTRLIGKGASGLPGWASMFKACGMSLSGATYSGTFTHSAWKSRSKSLYVDGRRIMGRGMMGNFVMNCVAGMPVGIDWRWLGGFVADPDAETMLTGMSYDAAKPPLWDGTGALVVTDGSDQLSLKLKTLTIDYGNVLIARPSPNHAGGYIGGWITNRITQITMDPEADAECRWHAKHTAIGSVTLSLVVDGGALNTWTIAATLGLRSRPTPQNRDGLHSENLVWVALNDSLTIAAS